MGKYARYGRAFFVERRDTNLEHTLRMDDAPLRHVHGKLADPPGEAKTAKTIEQVREPKHVVSVMVGQVDRVDRVGVHVPLPRGTNGGVAAVDRQDEALRLDRRRGVRFVRVDCFPRPLRISGRANSASSRWRDFAAGDWASFLDFNADREIEAIDVQGDIQIFGVQMAAGRRPVLRCLAGGAD